MAEKPEWVKSFARPRGTEIKHIRGHWYLYERGSIYDPKIKRSGKKSGTMPRQDHARGTCRQRQPQGEGRARAGGRLHGCWVRHGSGRGWARGCKSSRTSWKWASRSWLVARVGSGWGWGTLREAWGGPVRPLLPQEKGRQARLASERRYPHVVWTLCPRLLLLPSS